MAEAVIAENEISLNSVRYKLSGPVRRSLVSNYPPKTVIGDYTKDSHPTLSTLGLSDHRGGIGLDIMTGEGDTDRSWYSTADPRFKGHLILPPLVTATTSLPAGISTTYHLMAHKGAIWAHIAATSPGMHLLNTGTGAWGTVQHATTMVSAIWRWASGRIGSTFYIATTNPSNELYYYNGSAWATRTLTNIGGYLCFWNNRLWGVSLGNYKLWYTYTVGSGEVFLNETPLQEVTQAGLSKLFVGRDSAGEETLYLALATGLYTYDLGNDKWVSTGLRQPDNAGTAGNVSADVWRDDIYYGNRSSIFRYRQRGEEAEISLIGPDRDAGLPSTKGYQITNMVTSLNDLIVVLTSPSGNRAVIILAWNGQGWRVLYEGSGNDEHISSLLVAGIAGDYRLFFASNTTPFDISWLPLPSDVVNPLQISSYTYAAAATHDWPWFTAGQDDVTKVAVRVKVQTTNPTTAETVKVYYAINRSSTFQLMTNSTYTTGVITAAGLHTFDFPSVDSWVSTTAKTGTAFRSIQFRVVFARGGTTTNTPDVLSLSLEYYKKLDPKYQFIVSLDLNEDGKGGTVKQQRASLLTAQETATLVEFTYRDPTANSDATFYVQVQPLEGTEQTGVDERGMSTLRLVEV